MKSTTYSKIIDISVPLNENTVIYPGNPAIEIDQLKSQSSGSTISKITLGTHTGTHIDAPKHVFEDGDPIDAFSLDLFIGPCRVIDCTQDLEAVSRETVERAAIEQGERILLKTNNSLRGFKEFYPDFTYVSPGAAAYLAKYVSLIGIDYFSIKQKGSKDNRPHTEFLSRNIPIIEGIDLSRVEEGTYTLIAVPLKLTGVDGTLTRAILLQ